jgi:hypothetical protein
MLNTTPQPDAAALIAAALACPDLPRPIRQGILEGLCQLDHDDVLYENPDVLREMFKHHSPRKGKGGAR